ncbi:MAG: CTP synthase (glutamine hydrolyzing) [Nanoarchaeota archaeon]|nr:CTP synthase (glutamine hydrolyzing) [Nanoarchaeota archaeon]MCK5630524.1 CTP synthase (glutamine hydrolyzing) [Nanoarchaeota archaeon]
MTNKKDTKYIVVTGGVLSGLGKGAATAAMGRLLRDDNKLITIKCDGYLNVDPGTMNPIEHGEVFVLDDGGEVDMDFGHYERFLNITCKKDWNLTSGKIFNEVIKKEREGKYLGQTIQIFPHVIDHISNRVTDIAKKELADIVFIEIGGTIGDIEVSWFIEAAKQLKKDVGRDNVLYTHLTYVPYLHNTGEPKTKPAQRDIAQLAQMGISPDIVLCRSKEPLEEKIKTKLERMCDIDPSRIISAPDVEVIYEVPLWLEKQGLLEIISDKFGLAPKGNFKKWRTLVDRIKTPYTKVKVAICGKYTDLKDSYASIIESLAHAGAHLDTKVDLKWIETTDIGPKGNSVEDLLSDVKGIIVPGGFGARGTEGKIEIIKYARENNMPFLGLCYGLQLAVVEYARNVCGLERANSSEINPDSPHKVITIMPEQEKIKTKGATMRIGAYDAELKPKSLVQKLYNQDIVSERHRHRYEVNPDYHEILEKNGLVLSGMSPNGRLVEFIELPKQKFYVATQSHPELKSRLEKPAPLFYGFVKAVNK